MRRRTVIAGLVGAAGWPLAARAQRRGLPVIGFLGARAPEDSVGPLAAFARGLAEAGFADGRDVVIEYRWGHGDYDRLPALAAELAKLHVDVIAAGGDAAAAAAQHATSNLPIVFLIGGDPVAQGLVESFNRPGRNATGTTLLAAEIEAKRLGMLRELMPGSAAVTGVLINRGSPLGRGQQEDLEAAAKAGGQRLVFAPAASDAEIAAAFALFERQGVAALLVAADPYYHMSLRQIVAAAAEKRLPAVYDIREYPLAGGLMSYGVSLTDGYRQWGAYAGQILKGVSPATLPVRQPSKFELVINLKTAKALGIVIPPLLLARADEVIE